MYLYIWGKIKTYYTTFDVILLGNDPFFGILTVFFMGGTSRSKSFNNMLQWDGNIAAVYLERKISKYMKFDE